MNSDFWQAMSMGKQSLYIVRNKVLESEQSKLIEIKGDRKSIGGKQREEKRTFTKKEIIIKKNDMIYLTSDGFVDQQNSDDKKYSTKRFKEYLKFIAKLDMKEQKQALDNELNNYQSVVKQRDDITVIGIKV